MTSTVQELRDVLDTTPVADLPPVTELLCSSTLSESVEGPLSIAEVSELIGVSTYTLRYYERIGMVGVERDASGYRQYDRDSIGRLMFITRLRLSDMPIRDIQRYIALVEEGDRTIPERRELLESHRESIRGQLGDLQVALAVVDYKIATYGGELADTA
ncbi:MerR family transcriptional regulator [Solicola gregarius]|uniref:MerR family transcriptional regulator n=1 Tax=Solicola gregarius TaxID=2908642 RepID=A0AA46TLT6_9ACTN|nr:MerR family transcriptional regulator [Solicola gregarius]UYM07488.1 MerR family transcriptional regulator [Solicola gregarius]